MLNDDMTLVREFAAGRSEPAFAALVERHLGLVHSSALRQTGDSYLAQEIAQAVFILLARKAAALGPGTILSAWLYRATRHAAADALKARRRRQAREQEAYMQSTLNPPDADVWGQVAPLLDDAMAQLGETDRAALVLRFFENKSAREIAGALRLEEAAAQKRVTRALEKLRAIFSKRGVTLTATAIAGAVTANAVQAAPAGLTLTIKAASLASVGTGTLTLFQFMTLAKIKLGFSALVIAGAATAFVIQHQAQTKLTGEIETLRQQAGQLQADNDSLSNRLAVAAGTRSLAPEQFNELLKLRGEVGALQKQAGELGKLRAENQRLASLPSAQITQTADVDLQAQLQQAAILKITRAKQGVLGFVMFAADNQQQFPTNFAQAAPFFNDGTEQYETNLDIVYQGAITNIANPSATIVLRDKQGWQMPDGTWRKAYGFADGHAEIHSEPDGNFDAWENQRIIPPLPNQ